MIVDGTVDVAKGETVVAQLGPGDFVGEIALVADVPRTATVTASTPVRVLVLTDRGFERLIDTQPSIARKVMATLGERLHRASG
jgi:CRP-like cAMP-binding protein